MQNPRAIAARQIALVTGKGKAFDASAIAFDQHIDARDKGLTREICFGTLRHFHLLAGLIKPLLKKPLPNKDADIFALLVAGLYQLRFMQTPPHAAINSSVNACVELKKNWAKGLVNAVLRQAVRQHLHQPDQFGSLGQAEQLSHPRWLLQALTEAWPEQYEAMVAYNNSAPPMTLRVNTHQTTVTAYLADLARCEISARVNDVCSTAITLDKAVDVDKLPGFAVGRVSVQDAGAQIAAPLLQLAAGHRVLDACAAPGGKTIHMLQLQAGLELTALDSQASRLNKLEQDLQRCALNATVITGDAGNPAAWWNGEQFDRILLDAPCSGSGIISHHPDIKLLRKPGDQAQFADQQQQLIRALWPLLKPQGQLLYCTCSVMPQENAQVINGFLQQHKDASLETLELPQTVDTGNGYQLLPKAAQNGGFFFARLRKTAPL